MGAMLDERLVRATENTIKFLHMAAIELRRIAERAPEITRELHHIANQLEADADDLRKAARPPRS